MGKGSDLEGKSLEIGGLMMRDTGGKIEHIRRGTTLESDGGIDYERVINDKTLDYFEYVKKLKEEGKKDGER